jgi:hypothetical protein
MRLSLAFLTLAVVFCHPAAAQEHALFPAGGIRPNAVLQGKLGSCYFHSVIAAMAQAEPERLRRMIEPLEGDGYRVTFADGRQETVQKQDLEYARNNGYDLSEGEWVNVLFRAYAQRVLRESLIKAIASHLYFDTLKTLFTSYANEHDELLQAYDRAIRDQVAQNGSFDAVAFQKHLHTQLQALNPPATIRGVLEEAAGNPTFLQTVKDMIADNGELFGAYRAVGQGGFMERTLELFTGGSEGFQNESVEDTARILRQSLATSAPMVAGTAGSRYEQMEAGNTPLPEDAAKWYVSKHSYTVLDFDGAEVTLRNPWGDPKPYGVFRISLEEFNQAFWGIHRGK